MKLLQKGDQGDDVKKLQKLLISKGYDCGFSGIDGVFGIGTYNAVKAFQGSHNLEQTGIVDPATWASLNTNKVHFGFPTLRGGDKGDNVKKLQRALISKGFSCGPNGEDGYFGNDTYLAVKSFQGSYNLKQDGVVGPATWMLLNTKFVRRLPPTLKFGDKGDNVIKLQELLISKGYECGPSGVDGIFGVETVNAVKAFQENHNIGKDGVVGPATWSILATNIISHIPPTLRGGEKNNSVKKLQEMLIAKGYDCGSKGSDGVYGNKTFDAVKAFQRDHNLEQNGIVGPMTWTVLFSAPNKTSLNDIVNDRIKFMRS
ncbi:hypothetical protein LY90DRAFT_676245 [Neocallimastix californiae]|jgi:peptidoglycan hydrolase-like protein with peptidoglycan-binding domain|uniref:Peptidoglycan binding-like domain-containing protein n=1 Tax=Neocallimastix californiae TaxID=1754190 RepID=A0A1Y2AH26_9FUNG|nr:hypothetical protein LY90DRAFT_676245 [Neocallimastix californiae]|eukprot:ORY21497.1 hypothetical protein LY90DRAFT_676245 [Neocallimastix californiae]